MAKKYKYVTWIDEVKSAFAGATQSMDKPDAKSQYLDEVERQKAEAERIRLQEEERKRREGQKARRSYGS